MEKKLKNPWYKKRAENRQTANGSEKAKQAPEFLEPRAKTFWNQESVYSATKET